MAGAIRAVVFDLDGVLYEDARPVPGAADVVNRVMRAMPVRFLTNTTSKSRARIAGKLAALGFDARVEQVFSPAVAAARYLRDRDLSACLFVAPAAHEDFDGVRADCEGPDAVVIGDLADGWTYERLTDAFRLVHERGAALVGLGRSLYWRSARGLLLDVGPYLAALEAATGRQAIVFGKPERAVFEAVAADLGVPPERVAMVGDDLQVDVNPAQAIGMRGVLVRTGKFAPADLACGAPPDLVLDSVANLLD
jgi:HAD superfamily hydrolase (TIGR01458 family)